MKRYTGIKLIVGSLLFSATGLMLTGCSRNDNVMQGPANDHILIGLEQFKDLETFGSVAPKNSLDISKSRWGIELWVLDSLCDIDNMIEQTAESGIKWARFRTGGYFDVPAEEGYYRWRNMDKIINGLAENKINILFTLCRRSIDLTGPDISAGLEDYLDGLSRSAFGSFPS